jgi:fatty-acyl-CoA synthase
VSDPSEALLPKTLAHLGTKWAPRLVRVTAAIPVLGNGTIDKKPLRRDSWLCGDAAWWRPSQPSGYALMTTADRIGGFPTTTQ